MSEKDDPLSDLISKTANDLGEQFDAVLILASSMDGDGTIAYCAKRGNGFAVAGMASDFLTKDRHKIRINTEKQERDEPPHE